MKERPILFSAPMVRAILDGNKTQTRRIVKPQPDLVHGDIVAMYTPEDQRLGRLGKAILCPYGQVGDQLWVKETFDPIYPQDPNYNCGLPIEIDYRATPTERIKDSHNMRKWKPSIFMPREYSRIQLEITGIRAERLNDCSDEDAIAEGIYTKIDRNSGISGYPCVTRLDGAEQIAMPGVPRLDYRILWESINGDGSWDKNPWVWVVEFKVVKP